MLVSIVMPVYNTAAYLERTIRSIQAQTVRDWELLIINDASTDASFEILSRLALSDPRLKILNNPSRLGPAASRNRGIEAAAADWIAFCDSDDLWLPGKLERQLAAAWESGADMLFSEAYCIDDKNNVLGRFSVPASLSRSRLLSGNAIKCSTVMVRKDQLLRCPFEHDDLHEDYLCWMRLIDSGCRTLGIQEPLASYRLRQDSRSFQKFRSAAMMWKCYRVLGLPAWEKPICFFRYGLNGLRRYRFLLHGFH